MCPNRWGHHFQQKCYFIRKGEWEMGCDHPNDEMYYLPYIKQYYCKECESFLIKDDVRED